MTVEEKIECLKTKNNYGFEDLVDVVEVLRSEKGCPWDREQDHKSIRKDIIEETYEVIEAIDKEDSELLREELGDVMLQVVFHSRIEEEKNTFNIENVINDICVKLIHRHPHVFGDVFADTTEKVLSNWEKIKSEEKERKTVTDKLLAIPPMLPALMRAQKVGKKASCFDFSDENEVLDKMSEEMVEICEAIEIGQKEAIEEEVGDILLTITSLCRKMDIDAEVALNKATDKFISRFSKIEQYTIEHNLEIESMSSDELNRIWDENKHKN